MSGEVERKKIAAEVADEEEDEEEVTEAGI